MKNATRLQTTPYSNTPISQMATPSFLWVTQSALASHSLTNWRQTAKLSWWQQGHTRHRASSLLSTAWPSHALKEDVKDPHGNLGNLACNQHILSTRTEVISTVTHFSP